MIYPSALILHDRALAAVLAQCFENVAMAVSVVRQLHIDGESKWRLLGHALDLAAEAQSALKMAVAAIGAQSDKDQPMLFRWLLHTVNEKRIFVGRYMRNDDPADPTAWKDLRQRICETNSDVNVAHEQVRQKASLIDKAKHRASRFRNERADKEHSADVRRVAARLQNRVVIIIGGERKPHGCDALKSAFRLNDLIWISTRKHGSPGQLEDYVGAAGRGSSAVSDPLD